MRFRRRAIAFLPLLLSVPAAPLALQDGASARAFDLRLVPRLGEPLHVQRTLRVDVALEVSAGEKKAKVPMRYESRLEYVDELAALDQPAQGDLDVRRTFLRREQDEGRGIPRDDELTGAVALVTRRSGELAVELQDRLMRKSAMEDLLWTCESVAWPELPAQLARGQSCTLEPVALAALLGEQAVDSARATFVLEAVDERGLATLAGPLLATGRDPTEARNRSIFEGECRLMVDTNERRAVRVVWKGRLTLSGDDGETQTRGKGTFECVLSADTGAPAREALARKLVFRAVPRSLALAPVAFELPSHWFGVGGEEVETFQTSVHGVDAKVTLEFRAYAVGRAAHDDTIEAAFEAIAETIRLTDKKSVTSGLGKGRSARFRSQFDDGRPYESLIEYYPCGADRLLRAQMFGEPAAFAQEMKLWSEVRSSLKLEQ